MQWMTSQDIAKTAAYASPQLNNNQPPTIQCDVFSFGWVTVGEIALLLLCEGLNLSASLRTTYRSGAILVG